MPSAHLVRSHKGNMWMLLRAQLEVGSTFNNYGYTRTADHTFTAYDRLLQSMQIYRSTPSPFFRGTTRSGKRAPSHSQHFSGSLVLISMLLRRYWENKI